MSAECEPHTPTPTGYVAFFDWCDKKAKTHRCRRCRGCGLWAVWVPKKPRKKRAP